MNIISYATLFLLGALQLCRTKGSSIESTKLQDQLPFTISNLAGKNLSKLQKPGEAEKVPRFDDDAFAPVPGPRESSKHPGKFIRQGEALNLFDGNSWLQLQHPSSHITVVRRKLASKGFSTGPL